MREIRSRGLDKYDSLEYEYIDFGIFINHSTKKYHLAVEYLLDDHEDPEYPLEFLLERYGFTCDTEHNGTEIVEEGTIKAVAEFVSKSDSKIELIKMLSLSTIIDKQVTFVEFEDYFLLAVVYGIGKIFYDDRYAEVPVLGSRNSDFGIDNFEYIDYEMEVYKKMAEGLSIDVNIASDAKLQYVLLDNDKIDLVFYDEREYHVFSCELQDFAN